MTVQDWASLIVAILTIVSSIAFAIKWMVKHYLSELKPNSGSSMKDQISRLEASLDEQRVDSERSRDRQERKLDEMYKMLLDHIANNKK
jgi:YesN/AraC family two-component response regulator